MPEGSLARKKRIFQQAAWLGLAASMQGSIQFRNSQLDKHKHASIYTQHSNTAIK
jgi:hypothetical protein